MSDTETAEKVKKAKTVEYPLRVVKGLPENAPRAESGPRGFYKLLLQVIELDTTDWVMVAKYEKRSSAAIALRSIRDRIKEVGKDVALPEVPDGGFFEFDTRRLQAGSALYVRTVYNLNDDGTVAESDEEWDPTLVNEDDSDDDE